MTFLENLRSFLFWYETPKVVHIKSKKIGILGRFIQFCVISYILGFAMIYKKGYQEVGRVESSVVTKVKGVVSTLDFQNIPQVYRRIWDTSDVIIPSSEDNGFFVTTNVIVTPNQTRSVCSEDPEVRGAICDPSLKDCEAGKQLPIGNGVLTGRCIPSDARPELNVCEINAWCPVEKEVFPIGTQTALLEQTSEFTVLIKNFVKFPTFGDQFHRRNIMEDSNKTYLQTCNYHESSDPFCPVFKIRDMVNSAGENFHQLAVKGAIIVITIEWNCNLDWDFLGFCKPKYSFKRADEPKTNIAPGWNFRHANYHEENRRTLFKLYGIRFLIEVRGEAGKFNILPTLLNIGSGLALLGVTTVICDFFILYFTKRRLFYKEVKYLQVDGDNVTESELLRSRPITGNYQSI